VPIIDSLKEFRDSADQPQLRTSVGELVDQIESGCSLSAACAMQPEVFNPMYTSMLQAGEHSGRLVEVLADLLALLKWQDETLSSLRGVLIYPAFVCLVLGVVIGFLISSSITGWWVHYCCSSLLLRLVPHCAPVIQPATTGTEFSCVYHCWDRYFTK